MTAVKEKIEFGDMLKKYMSEQGLTQKELAKIAETTQPTISAICNGRRQCGPNLVRSFAKAFKLTREDRAKFMAASRSSRWRGLDAPMYGAYAKLLRVVVAEAGLQGIDARNIKDVVLDNSKDKAADVYLLLANGVVVGMDVSFYVWKDGRRVRPKKRRCE